MKLKYNLDSSSIQNDTKRPSIDYNGTKKYTIDEALYLSGTGRFNLLIILMSGTVLMGATVENISIAFALPYANCDLNMTTTEFGLVASSAFFGIVISSHFWGFMSDNPSFGRLKVIRLTSTGALISAVLSAFSPNAAILILLRFIVGIFISGLQASVFSYVSEFHTKETAPRAASFVSMFMPMIFIFSGFVGLFVMPMNWTVNLYFINFAPWRLYIVIITLVNALNALVFSFLPESPKFLMTMNKADDALDILRNMFEINTKNIKEAYPVYYLLPETITNAPSTTKGFVNILKIVWNQTIPIFIPPYLDSTVKLCFMVFTLFAIGHGTMMWMPDFFIQLQNNKDTNKTLCDVIGHARVILESAQDCDIDNSNTTTFRIMLGIGVVFTILSALISFYLNRISPRIIVPAWLILSCISAFTLNFFTQFSAIAIAFIAFNSVSLCAAIVSAISVGLYPTNVRAMATCFIFMFGRIGGLAGGNLVGVLVENQCNIIFNVFAVLSLICTFVFLLLRTEAPTPPTNDNRRNECSAPA